MGKQQVNSQSQSGNANWYASGISVVDPPITAIGSQVGLNKIKDEVRIRQRVKKGGNGQAQNQLVENFLAVLTNTQSATITVI